MPDKAKRLSEQEILEQAKVTPDDIEESKAAWKRDAPREFVDLLEAVDDRDEEILLL